MTKGLPGSGKSFWAEQYQRENPTTKIICKDDLRAMLDSGKWSGGREKYIVRTRNLLVEQSLAEGHDVIVADTNLHGKHQIVLKSIAADYEAEFIVKDFTDVPIKTCIQRDIGRSKSVGEKVIKNMYNQFLVEPKDFDVTQDLDKVQAIIVDIDGTLASCAGIRSPYDGDKVHLDIPNTRLIDVVNALSEQFWVIICTGREAKYALKTQEWLDSNGVHYDSFYSRETGDQRKDSIIKQEIYEREIKPSYDVRIVFDDRPQVIRMWKEIGLLVADVGPQYEF